MRAIILSRTLAVLLAVGLVAACSDDQLGPGSPPSEGTFLLSPHSAFLAVGESMTLSARLLDQAGLPSDARISWSSSNNAVARVDDSGRVTGLGEGQATIIARVGLHVQTAKITVDGPHRPTIDKGRHPGRPLR